MSDLLRLLYQPTPPRASVAARIPRAPSPNVPVEDMTFAERVWTDLEMWPEGKRDGYTSEYDPLKFGY